MDAESKATDLEALGIVCMPMPGKARHTLYGRGPYAALVELTAAGPRVGSSGMVTEHGLAMLMWREEKAYFVAKSYSQLASAEQVAELRQFAADLQTALQ